jgi:hypothetical protein
MKLWKLWHMRGHELGDPAERHALLTDLVEELQEREPELLVLIRKMVELIDEAEGELEREKDRLEDVINDLEKEIEDLETEIGEMRE